jgi:hypothetical protein
MREPSYWHERNYGCRITETIYRGLRCVTMENELLRVTILADKGSDIIEFLHKPTDTDFMWKSPMGVRNPATFVPTTARPDGAFLDYYEGGWQECMPTGGNGGEHMGTVFGLHGEPSLMPWEYTIMEDTPQRIQVRFRVRTVRSPFYIEKVITLNRNSSALLFHERITNEADEPLDLVWGHHPAFGAPFLDESCVVDVQGSPTVRAVSLGENSRVQEGDGYRWPNVPAAKGGTVDISRIPPPEARSADMIFLHELEEGWYSITNTDRAVGFGMAFPKDVFQAIWFWQVFRGGMQHPWYGRTYNLALEPWTTPYSTLDEAKSHNAHRVLQAGEMLDVHFAAVAHSGLRRVTRIHADGRVEGSETR